MKLVNISKGVNGDLKYIKSMNWEYVWLIKTNGIDNLCNVDMSIKCIVSAFGFYTKDVSIKLLFY